MPPGDYLIFLDHPTCKPTRLPLTLLMSKTYFKINFLFIRVRPYLAIFLPRASKIPLLMTDVSSSEKLKWIEP